MTVGVDKRPTHKLNLLSAHNSVALIGANRSGKTTFLSNDILNDMFPWWYRYVFPPRGFFLTGSETSRATSETLPPDSSLSGQGFNGGLGGGGGGFGTNKY